MKNSLRDVRSWIFLALALLLAGLTGLALYGVTAQGTARANPQPTEYTAVVVAKTDIAARTVLRPEMLARRQYPTQLVPAGVVASETEAVGETTLAAIPGGAPLVRAQLAAAEGKTGASLTVEKGKVLVAFPTTDPLTTAGLVEPGDHVDILATVLSGTGEKAKKTQTTVQNLEVLQVFGPTKEQPQRGMSLTFVVDHQVALVLKHLRDGQATIDIAVRSRAETEKASTVTVDLGYLIQTYGITR